MSTSYLQAKRGYLEWYSHLLQPPDADDVTSQVDETLDLFADRMDGFNFASEELTSATKPYLQADDPGQRTVALQNLLQQIEGDLEVANAAWEVITDEEDENSAAVIVRSVKNHRLNETFRHLAAELPDPSQPPSQVLRRSAQERRPSTLEEALDDLRFEVDETVSLINDRVINIGLRLLRDTLSLGSTEWAAIMQGVNLLKGREQVGNVGWGLEDEVKATASEVAGALRGVLGNIMEKVLVVIEKNDLVRYTIADWLEDLRAIDSPKRKDQFSNLLEQLYQTQAFRQHDLPIWLRDSHEVAQIHQAADEIMLLGDRFEQMANQIRRLSSAVAAGSLFLNPTLKSVGFALQIGLLSTLVFAGYDYLDEGTRALNITKGIKEVLIERLPVTAQTREEAENLRARLVR